MDGHFNRFMLHFLPKFLVLIKTILINKKLQESMSTIFHLFIEWNVSIQRPLYIKGIENDIPKKLKFQ